MRRRARAVALATSITLGAAGLMAPGTAQADPGGDCRPDRLDLPVGTTSSWVATGSPDGSVLGGYAHVEDGKVPVIWQDGTPEVLDIDLRNPNVAAVNDDGVVAGFGHRHDDNKRVSFLYEDGKITWLGAPDGMDGTVTDINADGDAVGYGVLPGLTEPLRWDAATPTEPEVLPNDGGGSADGINDAGEVVGFSGWPTDGTKAHVWHPDGTHEALPTVGDPTLSAATHIGGDHAGGHFHGSMEEEQSEARWNLADGTVTELPSNLYATHATNSVGEMAGTTEDDYAAIVRGEHVLKLPHAGGDHATAYTISDDGVAAGVADLDDDASQAVVWPAC